MFYLIWIQTKYKGFSLSQTRKGFVISTFLLFIGFIIGTSFVVRFCGWEEMGWGIKEEEDELRERIMGRVF